MGPARMFVESLTPRSGRIPRDLVPVVIGVLI